MAKLSLPMKKLLFLLLLVSGIASAQYTPTGSKTRFVNGIGLGTKLDAAFGTVDSLVLYASADSTLKFKYKGTARALMYASNVGAQIHDSLYAVWQLKAGTSAGARLVSNSGTVISEWGLGGSANMDFHGFAGYDANRSASYTARSFTDKNYVDSSRALDVQLAGTQTITGAKTFSSILNTGSRLNINGATDNSTYAVNILGGVNAYSQTSGVGSSLSEYSNNAEDDHQLSFVRYRGTIATPTAVQSGDDIGGIVFGGYNGASVYGTARVQAVANQTFSSGSGGTYLKFGTTSNGSSTLSYSTRMSSDGSWNIGSNSDPSSGFNLQVTGKQRITSDLALGSAALSGGAAAQWVTADGVSTYSGGFITSISGVAKSYTYSSGGYHQTQAVSGEGIKLVVNSNIDALAASSAGDITLASLGTGTVYSNSGVLTNTNPSDSTLKDSIMPMRYGLAEVLKLKPKTFYYKSDSAHTVKYGFIAQDVKPIMPDVVRKINPKDEKSKLGLETDGIYVTLVKAIQEQQAIIDDLKKRIIALENK